MAPAARRTLSHRISHSTSMRPMTSRIFSLCPTFGAHAHRMSCTPLVLASQVQLTQPSKAKPPLSMSAHPAPLEPVTWSSTSHRLTGRVHTRFLHAPQLLGSLCAPHSCGWRPLKLPTSLRNISSNSSCPALLRCFSPRSLTRAAFWS